MGNGAREESAYHRWESGWLPSSVGADRLTQRDLPDRARGDRDERAPAARGAARQRQPSYWLDFRQPLAGWFDDFSPGDPVVNGVSIRYANASTMAHPAKSWLIDTTPDTSDVRSMLRWRRALVQRRRRSGVSISTLSVSPLGALVRVTVPGPADTTPPSTPAERSRQRVADGQLNLSWTAVER